jgi:hypothetical protein
MLQSIETCASLEELFEKHIEPMLRELQASVDSWSLCSAERFIFEAILTYAGTCTHLLSAALWSFYSVGYPITIQ